MDSEWGTNYPRANRLNKTALQPFSPHYLNGLIQDEEHLFSELLVVDSLRACRRLCDRVVNAEAKTITFRMLILR
jgi:hypothetical protein